jgi:hypothetical protein
VPPTAAIVIDWHGDRAISALRRRLRQQVGDSVRADRSPRLPARLPLSLHWLEGVTHVLADHLAHHHHPDLRRAAHHAMTLLLMLWSVLRGEHPGCGDYECDECYPV